MTAIANAVASALTEAMQNAITRTAGAWLKASDDETKRRINFGREVGKAKAAILGAGGSDDDAEAAIWPVIVEAIGTRVEWKTLLDWVRAANVFDSLDPKVAATLNVEALKTVGRVPVTLSDKEKEDGRKTRAEFVEAMAEQGVSSIRDLRKQVAEERKSSSPKKVKTAASQAEETVQALKTITGDLAVPTEGVELDVIVGLVMVGVMLRDKVLKHQIAAVTEGVTEFFSPEAAPVADGSGASDDA